jgi:DNA-directed RNA polymerase subunit RPC12/RpoP
MDPVRIAVEFPTEEACLAYLEKIRWPEGVRCLKCGSTETSRIAAKEGVRSKKRVNRAGEAVVQRIPARRLYQCLKCRQQFTAKTGTLFNDSHLPLQKWFYALALIDNAEKGVSAKQMQRDLKVSYQTAWYLCHRIREIMRGTPSRPFAFISEADPLSEA